MLNLLDELWDTQNNISLTCKNIEEFTTNVLENSENFRSTRLFPVKSSKRIVIPNLLEIKSLQVKKHKLERITEEVNKIQENELYIRFKDKYSILDRVSYFNIKQLILKNFNEKKKSLLELELKKIREKKFKGKFFKGKFFKGKFFKGNFFKGNQFKKKKDRFLRPLKRKPLSSKSRRCWKHKHFEGFSFKGFKSFKRMKRKFNQYSSNVSKKLSLKEKKIKIITPEKIISFQVSEELKKFRKLSKLKKRKSSFRKRGLGININRDFSPKDLKNNNPLVRGKRMKAKAKKARKKFEVFSYKNMRLKSIKKLL